MVSAQYNLKKSETLLINCPWCGAPQEHEVRGSAFEIICNGGVTPSSSKKWCNRRISIEIDRSTGALRTARARSPAAPATDAHRPSYAPAPRPSFAGSATTLDAYEEAIRLINSSKHVSEEKKAQAKEILEHVRANAPYFLPVVAEGVKKVFYI